MLRNPVTRLIKKTFLANSREINSTCTQRFETLRKGIDCWVKGGPYPGIVAGIYDESGKEIFYHEVNKDSYASVKQNRETIYRLHSMTKPITATAAMILVERGILSEEDEISKWIPEFANTRVYCGGKVENYQTEAQSEPIRIKHLMTHTSGIPFVLYGSKVPDVVMRKRFGVSFLSAYREFTSEEYCHNLAQGPLLFQPNSGFEYSLGFEVLGHIMEIETKMRLDEFLKKEIFIPLGMVDTDFYVPPEKIHRLVDFTQLQKGHVCQISPIPESERSVNAANLNGGTGLNSTLTDYRRLALMLMNGGELDGVRVLQPSSVAKMTTNQLPDGKDASELTDLRGILEIDVGGFGYGYGMSVVTKPEVALGGELCIKGEFGWGGLSSSWFFVDPVRKYYFLCFTQLMPSNAYPIRAQLRYLTHWAMQK